MQQGALRRAVEHGSELRLVAAGAANVLAEAERAAGYVQADAKGAAQTYANATAEGRLVMLEAELRANRAIVTKIDGDLALVHAQLERLGLSIITLQTHSLRQTGGVALALSVLLVIAWKVIGG